MKEQIVSIKIPPLADLPKKHSHGSTSVRPITKLNINFGFSQKFNLLFSASLCLCQNYFISIFRVNFRMGNAIGKRGKGKIVCEKEKLEREKEKRKRRKTNE